MTLLQYVRLITWMGVIDWITIGRVRGSSLVLRKLNFHHLGNMQKSQKLSQICQNMPKNWPKVANNLPKNCQNLCKHYLAPKKSVYRRY